MSDDEVLAIAATRAGSYEIDREHREQRGHPIFVDCNSVVWCRPEDVIKPADKGEGI